MAVVKAEIKDLDRAVELAYSLQSHKETRCRPLLMDASKAVLRSTFEKYIRQDEHELLLVESDGQLIGLTPIYWMEEDLYVSYSQGPYGLEYMTVANELYDYVQEHFGGYHFYVNTAREHEQSIEFYEAKSFDKIEEAVLLKLEVSKSEYDSEWVQEIDSENKETILKWVDGHIDEDTYWNGQRISENLEGFIILGYFNKGLKGHIVGRGSKKYTEIIALSGEDEVKEALMKAFAMASYQKKVEFIDLYTEDPFEIELGEKNGFVLYDTNNCYLKYL